MVDKQIRIWRICKICKIWPCSYRRADKHPVLAIGLLQFLRHHWPRWDTHMAPVLCMPDQEGGVQYNVTLVVVGPMNFTKVGSAYICQICRIWTVHYSAYCFWVLHIILHSLHINFWGCIIFCIFCILVCIYMQHMQNNMQNNSALSIFCIFCIMQYAKYAEYVK